MSLCARRVASGIGLLVLVSPRVTADAARAPTTNEKGLAMLAGPAAAC